MPQPARPSRHRRRLAGGELGHGAAGVGGVARVDPRLEVGRGEVGEQQAEVGEVALGVDQQGRDAGVEALLDQHDAEAGLARAGHADDHAVRRQVAGGDRDGLLAALVRRRDRPGRRDGVLPWRQRLDARPAPRARLVDRGRCGRRSGGRRRAGAGCAATTTSGPSASRNTSSSAWHSPLHTPAAPLIGQWCSTSTTDGSSSTAGRRSAM